MAKDPENGPRVRPAKRPRRQEHDQAQARARNSIFERKAAQGAPEWSLTVLHGQLVGHAKLYEGGDLQDQRDAVAGSILAVHDYLVGRGFALGALVPLMRTGAALAERENGSLDMLFCERTKGGRPKATLADHERTGVLGALASFWLELHSTDDGRQMQKLARAARNMKGRWFGDVTAKSLKTARDLVMQEASDHPAVTEARRFTGEVIGVARAKFGDAEAWNITIQFLNDASGLYDMVSKIEKRPPVSPTG